MSIFGNLSEAIFGQRAQPRGPAQSGLGAGGDQIAGANPWWVNAANQGQATQAGASGSTDVEATLEAREGAQQLNWRTSIVDLMKLVGIDSSLENRKELAQELGYSGDMNDSAAMNVWLHRQVMRELAANGGRVPATLTD
jgi:hypothetical protein